MANEKAPNAVSAAPGAMKDKGANPCIYDSTMQDFCQDADRFPVSKLLGHGQASAITARELAAALGWPRRLVTRQIRRERQLGVPILASTDMHCPGYFLPASPNEIDMFLTSLQHRETEIRATRAAVARVRQQRLEV